MEQMWYFGDCYACGGGWVVIYCAAGWVGEWELLGPLEHVEKHDRSFPLPPKLEALCLPFILNGNKGRSLSVCRLSRCRVALRPAMLSEARIWPSVSRYLEISFGLRGPSPQAFTPFRGGLGSLPGAWGAPNKGNADGAEGIFGKLPARVGYGPAPGPTQKKALCHTCP